MADILLFGTHESGKTQLYYSLKGEEYKVQVSSGRESYKVYSNFFAKIFGINSISISELGGKDLFLTNKEELHNAFSSNKSLFFVFNGNALIDEIKDYKQGGYITTLLRCYVMPVLDQINTETSSNRYITFIATHKDEYDGPEGDMGTEIFTCLEKANEEYYKVANGTRYPFKRMMRGNLFCIDARNIDEVKDVFQQITKF